MRRLLHEPLLHFLVLGGLLFVLYGWVNGQTSHTPNQIVIDKPRAEALVGEFKTTWQRLPTQAEFDTLVQKWVREEILYREGIAEGFDRDDPVVRRRVIQKMSFLAESFASTAPTDAELQTWLDQHVDDYMIEPTISFQQVYFDPLKHDKDLDARITAAKAELERNPDAKVGDDIMLPESLQKASLSELGGSFGNRFAAALINLPTGSWVGPVRSGFGLHLVRISERVDARKPKLSEVRNQVQRDLVNANNLKAGDDFYAGLRKGYTVKVDFDPASLEQPKGEPKRLAENP